MFKSEVIYRKFKFFLLLKADINLTLPGLCISENIIKTKINLTLFKMGFFGAAHVGGWVGGHTYPTMMKFGIVLLYVKKIQKIYESRDIPLSSADISHFSLEISIFCYIKNNMDMYRLHFDTLVSNSLSFS